MKKDYTVMFFIIIALIIVLIKTCLIKDDLQDDYDNYKKEAEERIAMYQDSLMLEQQRLDSIEKNIKNFVNVDSVKKENLKIIYVQGNKEIDRVRALDTVAAVRFLSNRLYSEYRHQ